VPASCSTRHFTTTLAADEILAEVHLPLPPAGAGSAFIELARRHGDFALAGAAVVLELDPGLAFGTGSHPTTRLCMEWLEQHVQPGERTLDYGCGSGILAMVAKKLGAAEVIGVDIDPAGDRVCHCQ